MAFCSNIRIKHIYEVGDTTYEATLLDYDDIIDAPPSLDDGQNVQKVGFLRSEALKTYSRGNEFHTLEWTTAEPVTSVLTTTLRVFENAASAPKETGEFHIFVDNANGKFILKDATVESWSSTWDNKRESRTLQVLGGELQSSISAFDISDDSSTPAPPGFPDFEPSPLVITADFTTITADTF